MGIVGCAAEVNARFTADDEPLVYPVGRGIGIGGQYHLTPWRCWRSHAGQYFIEIRFDESIRFFHPANAYAAFLTD
jgi:hypothetical protein